MIYFRFLCACVVPRFSNSAQVKNDYLNDNNRAARQTRLAVPFTRGDNSCNISLTDGDNITTSWPARDDVINSWPVRADVSVVNQLLMTSYTTGVRVLLDAKVF